MKLAVIIPYKNAAEWLPKCLDSCYMVDGSPWVRFLMVNDGSEDGSEAIANDFDQTFPNFEAYNNEHKPGVSGARNTGLDHIGDADWFTFLDADDVMNSAAYFEIKRAIKEAQDTGADILQFNHLRQYGNALPIMKHYEPKGWRPLEMLPHCWVPVWNKAYKAEAMRSVRFKEGMQFGEDEMFNIGALTKGRGVYCSEGVTTVRRFPNPESLSKSVQKRDLEIEVETLLTTATLYQMNGDKPMWDVVRQRLDTLRALPRYNGIFNKEA